MIYSTLSYYRLYQLFGYKKKDLNLDEVMEYLLGRIVPKYFVSASTSSLDVNTLIFLHYDFSRALEELPRYLGKSYSIRKMMRIDARMRRLDVLRREYEQITWRTPLKKLKVWTKYNALRRERASLQTAFNYLEYRVKACGLGVVSYRRKFMAYAEKISKSKAVLD